MLPPLQEGLEVTEKFGYGGACGLVSQKGSDGRSTDTIRRVKEARRVFRRVSGEYSGKKKFSVHPLQVRNWSEEYMLRNKEEGVYPK